MGGNEGGQVEIRTGKYVDRYMKHIYSLLSYVNAYLVLDEK